MSYNNYVDTDAARRAAYDFAEPRVAIIKHANPCGIAIGADVAEAHRKAHACDPTSAFGGVIATNRPVTVAMAEADRARSSPRRSSRPGSTTAPSRCCVCHGEEPAAAAVPADDAPRPRSSSAADQRRCADAARRPRRGRRRRPGHLDAAAGEAALDADALADLAFAWQASASVKSNAILLAQDGATVGIGMGQVNRVDSCRLAVSRAGDRAAGSVAASDAFFPFEDGPQMLLDAGVARDRPARRLDPRRARSQACPGGRGDDVLHRHPALLPLARRPRVDPPADHGSRPLTRH